MYKHVISKRDQQRDAERDHMYIDVTPNVYDTICYKIKPVFLSNSARHVYVGHRIAIG